MSLNVISSNWHSHNDKNASTDVVLVSTIVIIKHLIFQFLTES